MTLPIDLILVRHGQSEGNLVKRRAEAGDDGGYSADFLKKHTRSYLLTKEGERQARETGDWLRKEFFDNSFGFTRYFTSEYARAMQTAALLDLPQALWRRSNYLVERNWGDLDHFSYQERLEKFGHVLKRREVEPFFWNPPNGESFNNLCLRVDRALQTLHREDRDGRVIIVCHGEVMMALRVVLERITQEEFRRLHLSKDPEDRIHNCEVLHYSRNCPKTGKTYPYIGWHRSIRPSESEVMNRAWQQIVRKKFSNEELLDAALGLSKI